MKKLALFLALILSFAFANAQRGTLNTITTDTVKGAETIYLGPIQLNGTYQSLSIQFLCTQLGGTTDGVMSLLASNDGTNYYNLNNELGKLVYASPYARLNDSIIGSLNIYNGATLNLLVPNPAWKYYKVGVTGTSGDTTKLTGNYVYK